MYATQDAETLLAIHRLRAEELRAEAAADRLARSLPRRFRRGPTDPDRPRSWPWWHGPGRHGPGRQGPGREPGPGRTGATALP